MFGRFEYVTTLQYEVRSLRAQVDAFRSGEKYLSMQEQHRSELAAKGCEIRDLRRELSAARREIPAMAHKWQQVFEDVEKEHAAELRRAAQKTNEAEERALKAERQRDEALDKLKAKNAELYRTLVELEDEKGKNLKLTAQVNRDFENSSIPSSLKPEHKKIQNSREKTGKLPGGQRGHEGHRRKRQIPTRKVEIPAPAEYLDGTRYKPTGETVVKQVVNVKVALDVVEYRTPEFHDRKTGRRVHAAFPEGVSDDVTYGPTIKAMAFLLNSHCNVSIDKTRTLMCELTGGALELSKGMVNGLCREFSSKTGGKRKEAWKALLSSPAMNTDLTSVRVCGKLMHVMVCASGDVALFFAREHKGHKSVEGTPVEKYLGILIHDHDITFYSYGGSHQECLAHVLRYLKDSIANEPERKWNKKMYDLLQEMVHYWKGLAKGGSPDMEKTADLERRYRETLELAREEYEDEPPSEYYSEGFNLYKRLDEFADSHLRFLHDARITPDNNLSERLLRKIKRKMRQMISWRSFENLSFFCDCLGVLESQKAQGANLYTAATEAFT